MMNTQETVEVQNEDPADLMLQQMLHLKQFETPDAERMVKNRQNIMRQVREVSRQKRWSVGDLLEVNIPWFFAEPRYGIAALFVVFAGLQFWGANSQKNVNGKTGIYSSLNSAPAYEQNAVISTNSISYPKLPDGLELFPNQRGSSDIIFVGRKLDQPE
jgi:hypothetical protein